MNDPLTQIRNTVKALSPTQLHGVVKLALAKADAGDEDARTVYAIAAAEHERRVGPAPRPASNVVDITDRRPARPTEPAPDRNEAIARIKAGLKARTGKTWSVTGGRGTAWGWITIDAPPARRTAHHVLLGTDGDCGDIYDYIDTGVKGGNITDEDRDILKAALGLDHVHYQGVSIAAGSDYRIEYVARAEGKTPPVVGVPYWD